jgi:hypothetical protein
MAIFMASGHSYSSSTLQHNKVVFGTPKAQEWFLNLLGASKASKVSLLTSATTPGKEEDSSTILCIIFQDFYVSMAHYHKQLNKVKAAQAHSKVETWNEDLKNRDSACNALADEFRKIMHMFFSIFVALAFLTCLKSIS